MTNRTEADKRFAQLVAELLLTLGREGMSDDALADLCIVLLQKRVRDAR